jgi:hypothetical protein
MTAPVTMEPVKAALQKIAMTAPVTLEPVPGRDASEIRRSRRRCQRAARLAWQSDLLLEGQVVAIAVLDAKLSGAIRHVLNRPHQCDRVLD